MSSFQRPLGKLWAKTSLKGNGYLSGYVAVHCPNCHNSVFKWVNALINKNNTPQPSGKPPADMVMYEKIYNKGGSNESGSVQNQSNTGIYSHPQDASQQ